MSARHYVRLLPTLALAWASPARADVDGILLDASSPYCAIVGSTGTCTITASGSYYLGQNIASTGNTITITADDVTLDLNGYELSAAGGTSAVFVTSGNVEVRNGKVIGGTWGLRIDLAVAATPASVVITDLDIVDATAFGMVIDGDNRVTAARVERVNAHDNGADAYACIQLVAVKSGLVADVQAANCGDYGIWALRSSGLAVRRTRVTENVMYGVYVDESPQVRLEEVIATSNDIGVLYIDGSDGGFVHDSNASCNASFGLNADDTKAVTFHRNTANANGSAGIAVGATAQGTIADYNRTYNNGGFGVLVSLGSANNSVDNHQGGANGTMDVYVAAGNRTGPNVYSTGVSQSPYNCE